MKNTGTVHSLFVSTKDIPRSSKESILVDKEGIIEDKFYAKDIQRSILIASLDSYILANKNEIDVDYGSLGENILIDINPYGLKEGDKISIGEVILEITQNCTICNSLAKIDKKLPSLLQNDRGIFAKTFKSGTIYKGDSLKVI